MSIRTSYVTYTSLASVALAIVILLHAIPVDAAAVPIYKKVSGKNKQLYAVAARDYFNQNKYLNEAQCKPEKVKISYYSTHDKKGRYRDYVTAGATMSDALAYTYMWGGFKNVSDNKKNLKVQYCTIYWNLDSPQNIADQCQTFVHEFGHLIGREHTHDINSVMYDGYTKDPIYQPTGQWAFQVNIDRVADKTTCPSYASLQQRADAKENVRAAKDKAKQDKKQAAQKKKDEKKRAKEAANRNKKIKLSKNQIDGLCIKTANPKKYDGEDKYVTYNGPSDKKWRMAACRDGAKIGVKDYKNNKKTKGACYKDGRTKQVQNVCDYGRAAAIDRLRDMYGYRAID